MESMPALPDDPGELAEVIDMAVAKLAAAAFTASTEDQLLATAEVLERTHRRFDGVDAALYVEISDRGAYSKAGFFSLHGYLAGGLRLGDSEAKRRRLSVGAIGSFSNLQGQTLPPARPATAEAVADGAIGADHVVEIDAIMDKIPASVDPEVKAGAEAQLALVARDLTPNGVRAAGWRLLAHLDPDGSLTEDRDRKRFRTFGLGRQDRQLMSKVRASLTPELRARFEVMFESWAAPGMNNPDDPDSPRGALEAADPATVAAAAERDDRSFGQRQHDALLALLEAEQALRPGAGRRLSSELVITVTDRELAQHAGVALTATGTRVPVSDLVKLAADAVPHLAVFAHATGQALYLGRGARLANKWQRLMLFGRDRGCTGAECSMPFSRTEAHHFPDWADGGETNIDHLAAACGRHNRSVGKNDGQWETKLVIDGPHAGRVAWRPRRPGKRSDWRVNHMHHAELLPIQGPHAPPAAEDSRVEAYLEGLLGA